MDPRLRLLVESGDDADEVAVLVRLGASDRPLPPQARIVTSFADVATIRAPRASVSGLRESADSVKAPSRVLPEPVVAAPPSRPPAPDAVALERESRGLDDLPLTGAGVVVGVLDWGLDVTHPAFRNPDGSTRVLALWDQQPGPQAEQPNKYGYGRIHDRAAIDRALRSDDPGAMLGYLAQLSDLGAGTHGTATTSIAAGSDWPGGVPGLARDADIVFVHLSTWGPDGPQLLGDSVALAEAFDFVRETAAGRPFVVNCSLGGCCGPHDGSTLLERAMDNLVSEGQGLVAMSCGNYLTSNKHTTGWLESGEQARLPVEVPAGSPTPHELDLWYAGPDRLTVTVTGPGGSPRATAEPGGAAVLEIDGAVVGHLLHRLDDPNDRRNQVLLRLETTAPRGIWEVVVRAVDVRDGQFHTWIERDPVGRTGQAHFAPQVSAPDTTTGTICNGLLTLAVGAYDHHDSHGTLAPFSSQGPSLNGRAKPDCVAPGVRTLVARSRPPGASPGGDVPLLTVMSGTSMAAPHVAGLLACLLQAGPLPVAFARAAVLRSCQPYAGEDPARAGRGYLRPAAAMAYVLNLRTGRTRTIPTDHASGGAGAVPSMQEGDMTQTPESFAAGDDPRRSTTEPPNEILDALGTTARELVAVFVAAGSLDERSRFEAKLRLLGGPGDLVDSDLRAGDLVVRGAVGEGAARVMALADGRLLTRDRAIRAGWDLEGSRSGQYAVVVESGRSAHSAEDRFARLIKDEDGLVPAGQALLRLVRPDQGRTENVAADTGAAGSGLHSSLFAGDDELAAVAAGRFRLAIPGTSAYPAPVTSSGSGVRKVQQALAILGYPVGASGPDGRFGGDTGRATSRYKSERGISPSDPVVGPTTIRRLDDDLVALAGSPQAPPVDPPGPPDQPDQRVSRWVAALGPRMRPGNQVTGLVDGPETFGAFLSAIRTATGPGHFIYLLGWWLDLDVPLETATQPAYCSGLPLPAAGATTMRTLLRSADSAGVQVRVMLWDQTGSRQNTAEVRYVSGLSHGAAILDNNQLSYWAGSQHQKVLIVGGSEGVVAFCGGVDINPDRICPIFPPGSVPLLPGAPSTTGRRERAEGAESATVPQLASGVLAESSSGSSGGGGDPLHDVHVRITGPAADDLLQVFVHRWYANPEHLQLDRSKGALRGLCQPPSAMRGQAFVRVDETFNATYAPPRGPVHDCSVPPPLGQVARVRERGIQDAYLTAIARARRFIYWEDQYMVNMCAAEYLRRALPQVAFIVLLMADSSISDMPHRWAWRKRFIEHIRRDPQGSKLHVFTLRNAATGGIGPHTYVHAKTLMIDDELSIIGSANCNLRGWESDTEVTATIVGDPDFSGRPFAARIRQRLWAEHLGVPMAVVEDPVASAPLWWLPTSIPGRTVALPGGQVIDLSGRRVLPYDVNADTDSTRDSLIPDDIVDPPAPVAGSPCGGTPVSVNATDPEQRRLATAPVQSVRFAVG